MSRHVLRSTTVQGIVVMAGALVAPHVVAGFDAVFLTVGLFAGLWALRGRLDAAPLSWGVGLKKRQREMPEKVEAMPEEVLAEDPNAGRRKIDAVFEGGK